MERSLFFSVVLLTVVCWQGLLQAASIDEDFLKALEKLERKDSELESHKRADIKELRTLMSKWVAKRVLRYKYKNDEYGWLDGFKKKGSTRSCNSDAVGECVSSLQDIYAFAGALMFPVSDGDLAKSCGEISSTSQCVQGAGCSDADSISVQWGWTGIKDSLSYLCTDSGKQGLRKFQGCVSDKADDYLITVLDCLSEISESKDCSYYNAQLKCYADTARDLCDSKDFVVTYYVKAYQPLTTHDSGCTYSYQKKEALRQKIQSLLSQLDK